MSLHRRMPTTAAARGALTNEACVLRVNSAGLLCGRIKRRQWRLWNGPRTTWPTAHTSERRYAPRRRPLALDRAAFKCSTKAGCGHCGTRFVGTPCHGQSLAAAASSPAPAPVEQGSISSHTELQCIYGPVPGAGLRAIVWSPKPVYEEPTSVVQPSPPDA